MNIMPLRGIYVLDVDHTGSGRTAALRQGDVILGFGGTKINSISDMATGLNAQRPFTTVTRFGELISGPIPSAKVRSRFNSEGFCPQKRLPSAMHLGLGGILFIGLLAVLLFGSRQVLIRLAWIVGVAIVGVFILILAFIHH